MRAPTITAPTTRAAEFREVLAARPLVADGGMSSMLRARRTLVNRSLDELNLSLPALVRDVHQEFLRAGAEILRSNTSGANRPRLEAFGYGDRVRAVNQAGVRIAREAAREQAFIAGVVGPLGAGLEPLGVRSAEAARVLFREQTDALVYAGVDLLMLEAFSDLGELEQAVAAARESAGSEMVVMAELRVEADGRLADGTPVAEAGRRIEEWAVDVIGLGCGAGPAAALAAVEELGGSTSKALAAMPEAGARVGAEYLARYAARFLRAGVRVVGGGEGVGPEHVRAMAGEVRALAESEADSGHTEVRGQGPAARGQTEADGGQRTADGPGKSGLGEKIDSRKFVTLVEIASPRGVDVSREIELAGRAKLGGADAVVVVDGPGARLSAAVAAQLIAQRAGIETVLPVGDVGIRELLDADALGIRNLLCLTSGTAEMVRRLNAGVDLGGNSLGSRTWLMAGVMVDPAEETPAIEGAEFVVTRPVYDVTVLERFLERCSLPVIVGLRPLKNFADAEFTIHELGVAVPAGIVARLVDEGAGVTVAREILERVRERVAGVYWSGSFAGELH